MKKNSKRISLLLSLIMVLTAVFPFTAFALEAGSETMASEPTRHVLELDLAAGDEVIVSPMRLYSGFSLPSLASGKYYDHTSFTADGNYIGYEVTGWDTSGNACSGTYKVSLMRSSATISSISTKADGARYKADWVSITSGYTYFFRVTNNSSQALRITVEYYTWS